MTNIWTPKLFESAVHIHVFHVHIQGRIKAVFLSSFVFWLVPKTKSKTFGDKAFFISAARFSKVPKTFRARKAISKTATHLFCKAGLLICCKGNTI